MNEQVDLENGVHDDENYEWDKLNESEEHNSLLKEFRKSINDGNSDQVQVKVKSKVNLAKYDLKKQPQNHQVNKGFMEKCCKCCIEKQDLNRGEIRYFYKFKEEMVRPYDEKNEMHEELLRNFYIKVFEHQEQMVPERLLSEEWTDIGFQGKNPRTDFRGGGILSLYCMQYFVDTYPEYYQQIRNDKSESFFFAISSINITHHLMVYLYLNRDEVSTNHKKLRAGRKQFKTFAKLNSMSKKTFYELHSFALSCSFYIWKNETSLLQSKKSLPNFNDTLDKAREEVHELLRNRISDIAELKKKAHFRLMHIMNNKKQQ